jgi:hypothetical protein
MGEAIAHAVHRVTVLYWLYDESCHDPFEHGYIGITDKLSQRIGAHRSGSYWFPTRRFRTRIIAVGTRSECAKLERDYRPEAGIGWNRAPGGGGKFVRLRLDRVSRLRLKLGNIKRAHGIAGDTRFQIYRAELALIAARMSVGDLEPIGDTGFEVLRGLPNGKIPLRIADPI